MPPPSTTNLCSRSLQRFAPHPPCHVAPLLTCSVRAMAQNMVKTSFSGQMARAPPQERKFSKGFFWVTSLEAPNTIWLEKLSSVGDEVKAFLARDGEGHPHPWTMELSETIEHWSNAFAAGNHSAVTVGTKKESGIAYPEKTSEYLHDCYSYWRTCAPPPHARAHACARHPPSMPRAHPRVARMARTDTQWG